MNILQELNLADFRRSFRGAFIYLLQKNKYVPHYIEDAFIPPAEEDDDEDENNNSYNYSIRAYPFDPRIDNECYQRRIILVTSNPEIDMEQPDYGCWWDPVKKINVYIHKNPSKTYTRGLTAQSLLFFRLITPQPIKLYCPDNVTFMRNTRGKLEHIDKDKDQSKLRAIEMPSPAIPNLLYDIKNKYYGKNIIDRDLTIIEDTIFFRTMIIGKINRAQNQLAFLKEPPKEILTKIREYTTKHE